MRALADFCLVEAHPAAESYSLHTCFHDWTLSSLNREIDFELYGLAFRCVLQAINQDETDLLALAQNRRLVPLATRLDHNYFHKLLDEDEWVEGNLDKLDNVAWLLRTQAKFLTAEHIYKRSLRGYERIYNPEHPSTLKTVIDLGITYRNQGKIAEAEEMYIRALHGFEKIKGPENTSTLKAAGNLGILYWRLGKMTEAEEMYIRAMRLYLQIHEKKSYKANMASESDILVFRNRAPDIVYHP